MPTGLHSALEFSSHTFKLQDENHILNYLYCKCMYKLRSNFKMYTNLQRVKGPTSELF